MDHTDRLNATHGHCPANGSLFGGGDLGDVDLIYVPEPSALVLFGIASIAILTVRLRRQG